MMKRLFVLLLFVLVANAASAQYTAVRVNTLGLATGTVNAGVDVAVSEKWSVEASAYWNPISTESLRTKVLGAVVGVRRWRFEPHVGFFGACTPPSHSIASGTGTNATTAGLSA